MVPGRDITQTLWLVVREGDASRLAGQRLRLSVLTRECNSWRHRSLYAEIVHRAPPAPGPAGAIVIREITGRDTTARIHLNHLLRRCRLPLLIVIIAENRLRGFLPRLDDLEISGLVTLDKVDIIRYITEQPTGQQPQPQRRAAGSDVRPG